MTNEDQERRLIDAVHVYGTHADWMIVTAMLSAFLLRKLSASDLNEAVNMIEDLANSAKTKYHQRMLRR